MDLICPECLGKLETSDGQTARCTVHGGSYQVLFSRHSLVAPPPILESASEAEQEMVFELVPGSVCAQHTAVEAAYACQACGAPICETCAFSRPGGGSLCPNCAVRSAESEREALSAGAPASAVRAIPEGVRCVQHPHLHATAQCALCGAYMCETCDFALSDGNHVCPACAVRPSTALSGKRKSMVTGSYVLAILSTLALVLVLSGMVGEDVETEAEATAIGLLFIVFVLLPAIGGVSLAVSAKSRRGSNPASVWVALVWNAILIGVFLLLCVVGNFM